MPESTRSVAVLVGSLRKASLNRRLAVALAGLAPPALKLGIVEIGDLPPFNQDWEADPPESVRRFKSALRSADAVLFVTPEYNRSVPGVLKNAIDVASRPYGDSAWDGKAAAVVSASPGAIGGFGANHHLRQSMVFLNVAVMPQPEIYLGHADKKLDGSGGIADEGVRKLLAGFVNAFARWIETQRAAAR
jgi:chromate reductase